MQLADVCTLELPWTAQDEPKKEKEKEKSKAKVKDRSEMSGLQREMPVNYSVN